MIHHACKHPSDVPVNRRHRNPEGNRRDGASRVGTDPWKCLECLWAVWNPSLEMVDDFANGCVKVAGS